MSLPSVLHNVTLNQFSYYVVYKSQPKNLDIDSNQNYLAADEKSVGRCLRQLLAAAAAAAAAAAKKYSEAPELSRVSVIVEAFEDNLTRYTHSLHVC